MSRGPGYIERAVADCVEKCKTVTTRQKEIEGFTGVPPENVVSVTPHNVAIACGFWEMDRNSSKMLTMPTKAQHKAILRALHSFVRKFPEYGLASKSGGGTCLYERSDPLSVKWAEMCAEHRDGIPLTWAKQALAYERSRRNEPFSVRPIEGKLVRITRTGKKTSRPRGVERALVRKRNRIEDRAVMPSDNR